MDGKGEGGPGHRGPQVEDEEVAETDPEGRYYRYQESVGRGRFKETYKAFDTLVGIDVAWSKINADPIHLTDEQLERVVDEMQKGLDLEHPNIIKCFKCWHSVENHCINLITELFTSGNLRQYRHHYKHLDLKAVKRMARQILRGLDYLHSKDPPLYHGDLRCDKIYVNGHSGEIKIGDLGLATLLPIKWQEAGIAELFENIPASDIFAFGLCMLELMTLKQLDPQHCKDLPAAVADVTDEEARNFIGKCVGPMSERPTPRELLDEHFLDIKKQPRDARETAGGVDPNREDPFNQSLTLNLGELRVNPERRRTDPDGFPDDSGQPIAVGKLRGEDYNFEFMGKVKEGKMHFRLVMTQANDAADDKPPFVRTVDFVFDPEVDTADTLANEISQEFNLSSTDTEICAAALREWLAKEMPGIEASKSR